MSLVLSIDLGTSGCRSAVYDDRLRMVSCAKLDCPLIVHSATEIEQDADVWWTTVSETAREAASRCDARAIRAVSISSQGISIVPVDANGVALANAFSWLDTRAAKQCDELKSRFGEAWLRERTGLSLSPLYTVCKLMWMLEHMAPLLRRARKFLLPMDFILLRLCGQYATNHTMACGTMLYNIAARDWDETLLEAIGLDRDRLPPIRKAGEALGAILPQVAKEWGLSENVLVAVGAQDQKCAAFGASVSEEVATASLGTACCISKLIPKLVFDKAVKIPCYSYLRGDAWDLEGIVNTAGSALGWFRDAFAKDLSFGELDGLAEKAGGPQSVAFYPYLAGSASPHWGAGAGVFTGLTLKSGVGHCARAVMEGVAYHIRENLDAMDRMGAPTRELRLFGGGAASDLWCRIIADVTSRPVARMSTSDTALAGAARLAFASVGVETGAVETSERFEPQPDSSARYGEAYEKYERFRERCFM